MELVVMRKLVDRDGGQNMRLKDAEERYQLLLNNIQVVEQLMLVKSYTKP